MHPPVPLSGGGIKPRVESPFLRRELGTRAMLWITGLPVVIAMVAALAARLIASALLEPDADLGGLQDLRGLTLPLQFSD